MEVGKLNVSLRKGTGKGENRKLRSAGLVPGICYGAHLDAPVSIAVNPKALKASLDPQRGRNTVIAVTVEDDGKTASQLTAMLWDYQIDSIRREVTHVDLIAIDPEKQIEVEVKLVWVGKHAGAIDGGQLHVERHSLPVRCRPQDIPSQFDVDITSLHIGDALHVSDVTMPPGVTPAVPTSFTLITCTAPKAEKETTTSASAEAAAEGDKKDGAKAAAKPAAKAEGGDKKK